MLKVTLWALAASASVTAACSADPDPITATAVGEICTIQDQMDGTCPGPVTALWDRTYDEAYDAYGGDPMSAPADRLTYNCIKGVANQYFCSLSIDLIYCRIVVNCTKYADGMIECTTGCF